MSDYILNYNYKVHFLKKLKLAECYCSSFKPEHVYNRYIRLTPTLGLVMNHNACKDFCSLAQMTFFDSFNLRLIENFNTVIVNS